MLKLINAATDESAPDLDSKTTWLRLKYLVLELEMS